MLTANLVFDWRYTVLCVRVCVRVYIRCNTY